MKKLVKCKTCGEEIAKSAKVCPNCGAKQGSVIAKVCSVILVIAVIIFIVGIGSSGSNKQESEPTAFSIGDQVDNNDIVVMLVNVSENHGGNYMVPSDGKVFLVCEFEIENNSDKDIGISSLMSFEAYVDDYSTAMSLSATLSTDKTQLDGTVASGKKMNGVIGYEVDPEWSELEIRFTPDFWSGEDTVFKYSKDA